MWYKIVTNDLIDEKIIIPDTHDGLLISESVRLSNVHLIGGQTQLVIRKPCIVENCTFENFGADGIILSASNCIIRNCNFLKPTTLVPYSTRHPDTIQFVAIDDNLNVDVNGIIYNTLLENIVVYAPDSEDGLFRGVQGITGFDCRVTNLTIRNFTIRTDFEQHGISFNSAENCTIENGIIDSITTDKKPGIIFKDRKLLSKGFNNSIKNVKLQILDVEDDTILENVKIECVKDSYNGDLMYKEKKQSIAFRDHMQIAFLEATRKNTSEIYGVGSNPEILKYWDAVNYKAEGDEVPWCAAFVNYVLREAGIPRTESPAAMSFKKWGVDTKPKTGCIVVIPRGNWQGHVGFLVSEDDNYYYILGGNQNNQVNTAAFKKSDHEFYFRWHNTIKKSTTVWSEIAKMLTGLGGTGWAGYEIVDTDAKVSKDITVNPDTGSTTSTVDTKPTIETQPSSIQQPSNDFEIPNGYKLIPDFVIYSIGIGVVICLLLSLYIIKERIKKINEYGI